MSDRRIGYMLSLAALLTASWLPAANANDKPTAVYTGTLGKQAVVFDLGGGSDLHPGNYYFYTQHNHDLALDGTTGTDHLALREGSNGGDDRPLIILDRQADGGWRGRWQGPKGKVLPIVLHSAKPAPPAADALPYLKQMYASNIYEYLRLTNLKPQTSKRESFMGHTLQWWRVPDSGIAFFEILDGYPDAERQRINRVLMDRLLRETSAYYDCIDIPADGGAYNQTVTPRLLTPSLVSVSVFTSYDCGGAHPDFDDNPINLDANTAKTLALEDILRIGKGKPLHYTEGENGEPAWNSPAYERYSSYRKDELTPWLVRQWKHLYPDEMHPAQSNYDCDYGANFAWEYVTWYTTTKGIFIIPSLDGAVRACREYDDWSLLPWSIVLKHPGRLGLTP